MNRKIKNALIILAMSSVFSHAIPADDASKQSWQLSLLFNPGEHQYEMERRGRVFIYDGLRDSDIKRAFNEQYDRIESMMFVNTVVTDDDGVPLTDPKTGEFLVENDGCD